MPAKGKRSCHCQRNPDSPDSIPEVIMKNGFLISMLNPCTLLTSDTIRLTLWGDLIKQVANKNLYSFTHVRVKKYDSTNLTTTPSTTVTPIHEHFPAPTNEFFDSMFEGETIFVDQIRLADTFLFSSETFIPSPRESSRVCPNCGTTMPKQKQTDVNKDCRVDLKAAERKLTAPGVNVQCNSDNMTIIIPKSLIRGIDREHLRLLDTTCKAEETSAHFSLTTPLEHQRDEAFNFNYQLLSNVNYWDRPCFKDTSIFNNPPLASVQAAKIS
ncbi:hypothetical protein ACROYT_G015287 [Oculina patagonica]